MLREQARLKSTVDGFDAQCKAAEDAGVLIDLADEAKDEATAVEAADDADRRRGRSISKMEFARMLSGPYDRNGALVSINAGAGGTESQDWAEMLLRMYIRWAERKGFKLEELDLQPGDEAGIKSATIGIEGEWAYGWLRAEAGVHRLVRISPFDAQRAPAHLVRQRVRLSGHRRDHQGRDRREGPAHRRRCARAAPAASTSTRPSRRCASPTCPPASPCTRTASARSTRTGRPRCASCAPSCSSWKQKKQEEKMGNIHAQKKAIEWGSQIRSYVLAPYRLVTDHRTELKVGNVDAVLDGDLDQFMVAMLLELAGDPSAGPVRRRPSRSTMTCRCVTGP